MRILDKTRAGAKLFTGPCDFNRHPIPSEHAPFQIGLKEEENVLE